MTFPQILESGVTNDFPNATYSTERVEIDTLKRTATIYNNLQNCDQLEKAVERGDAEWIAELRAPRSLHSEFKNAGAAGDSVIEIQWDDSPSLPQMYLFSCLVAAREFKITGGLSDVWIPPVTIPRGAILARSRPQEIPTETHNLLVIRCAEEEDKQHYRSDGSIVVEEDTQSPLVKYIVYIPKKIYTPRFEDFDRSMLIGALGEALRLAAKAQKGKWEDPDVPFSGLRSLLSKHKVNWDSENFSPFTTAGLLVPFRKPSKGEGNGN